MPKYLAPPNQQHPTYFDVAKPVQPEPPPVVQSDPVVELQPVAANAVVRGFTPTSSAPIVLQGKLKTPVTVDNDVSVVLPAAADTKPFEHFTIKTGAESHANNIAVTTPDPVTKANPNRMRSSTHKSEEEKPRKFRS